ncbi:MAG: plasmid stabilization protein [Solirubrobacterales bacterium]
MPPRGVRKGTKRARQYSKIKSSARRRGASPSRAREMAARTVNKNRARSGESRTRSRSSTRGPSPQRRGGQRSGSNRPKGQTKEQLYNKAKRLRIDGRSSMNKSQLQRAVAAKSR